MLNAIPYTFCISFLMFSIFSALLLFSLKYPQKSFPYLPYFVHCTHFSSNEKRWYHLYKKMEKLHIFIWKGKKI